MGVEEVAAVEEEAPPEGVEGEESQETEGAEPAAEGAAANAEPKTLDEILASGKLDWLKAQQDQLGSSAEVTLEDMSRLDHNGQRVVAGLMKLAGEKRPDAEARERELAAKEQEVAARERLLLQRQAGNLGLMRNPKALELLKELQGAEGDAELDPYTPEGFAAAVKREVAGHLGKLFGTFEASEQELNAAYAQAQQEAEAAALHAERVAYIEANEDTFSDPEIEARTVELVKGHAFTVQEAHRLALAEKAATDHQANRTAAVARSQERVARGGRTGPRIPPKPEGLLTDAKVRDHFDRNPGAMEAEFRRRFPGHNPEG